MALGRHRAQGSSATVAGTASRIRACLFRLHRDWPHGSLPHPQSALPRFLSFSAASTRHLSRLLVVLLASIDRIGRPLGGGGEHGRFARRPERLLRPAAMAGPALARAAD